MRSISPIRSMYSRQSGVALAILVWFLAAMSILVAGIVYQAKMDVKLAQLQLRMAQVQAAGDGAIQLALADMLIREMDGEFVGRGEISSEHRLGGYTVAVFLTPVAGMVDLNSAKKELLTALFVYAGELDNPAAQELARNVLKWRSPKGSDAPLAVGAAEPRNGRFESIEDLLLVYGVDRQLFDRLKDAVYVAQAGQAGVDWFSAPASVLQVLGEGEKEMARAVTQFRTSGSDGIMPPPAGLNTMFQEEQAIPLYRADAFVLDGDLKFKRRRWVSRTQGGVDGLPWSFFRTERVRAWSALDRELLMDFERGNVGS
jgi:general secretion pathway protein K